MIEVVIAGIKRGTKRRYEGEIKSKREEKKKEKEKKYSLIDVKKIVE